MTTPGGGVRSRHALRTQVGAAFGFTAVLALISLSVVGWAFNRQIDARNRVLNRIDPAAITARDVFAALVDQETGVRGYALARDLQFLTPYTKGKHEQAVEVRVLRNLVAGNPGLEARVTALDAAATRWRRDAATRLIAAARTNRADLANTALIDRSKSQFDAVRRRYAQLDTALSAARESARDEINTKTTQVVVLGVVVLALLIACGFVIWIGLRRLVLAPIDRLGGDAVKVTAGEVEHAIEPSGPKEIALLGDDIEAMRRTIVDDLATAEAARTELARQALELGRSNAELEQFVYVASHDLQEPLRKVASFCQLIEQRYGDQLDDRGKQYIDFAVDGAKRMQQLILDLLAFSRVGRTTAGFVPTDLNLAVADAMKNLTDPIRDRNVTIEVGNLPTTVGDLTLLTALFQNLISNAIKFNESEVPRIVISAQPVDDGWELAVADNGIGIEPQHAARVFMIFQRLHARDVYEGTGIGLALAQKIVTYHGGTIWIDPDVTTGTTIRWTLPTNVPATEPATQPGAPIA